MYTLYKQGDRSVYYATATYKQQPDAPDGFEWVEGRPPNNIQLYGALTQVQQAQAALAALSPEERAVFSSVVAQVLILDQYGDTDARNVVINNVQTSTEQQADVLAEIKRIYGIGE